MHELDANHGGASARPILGFIGLGAMGGAMTANLVRAGYTVYAFDLDAQRMDFAADHGAETVSDIATLVEQAAVILTSLPSSRAFVQVAESELLPRVRAGQLIIDVGTVTPPEARRLAAAFAAKEVQLIDAPVSGGPRGAQEARLFMFVGGDEDAVARVLPILETVAGRERMTYCGSAGCGQVVKGVNQLMMGLVEAAHLEAIAFGVNAGVDPDVIARAIGHEGRYRVDFHATANRVAQAKGQEVGVKFRELPYFLQAAQAARFPLPLTATLHEFCDQGERVVIDDNRPAPSFWHELTHRSQSKNTNSASESSTSRGNQ
jgi:3-hydroxyisobutyrate dehydrogenase